MNKPRTISIAVIMVVIVLTAATVSIIMFTAITATGSDNSTEGFPYWPFLRVLDQVLVCCTMDPYVVHVYLVYIWGEVLLQAGVIFC